MAGRLFRFAKSHFPSIPALALYLATVLSEFPVIFVRMLLTLALAAIVLLLKGDGAGGAEGYVELALIPTAWAIFALITPFGGGWWWRQNMGGREPSERERAIYRSALALLRPRGGISVREPGSWFVLDLSQPDASVCGETLALSRGLLETTYLPAVLAHELGHLNTSDGRLTAALNRLVIHPPPGMSPREPREHAVEVHTDDRTALTITLFGALLWLVRKTVSFAKGGFALRLLSPFWGSYWREREYVADAYAASLGQAGELADFLEIYALAHDHPVPFIWLTEHTHPPTELRIDMLRKAALVMSKARTGDVGEEGEAPGPDVETATGPAAEGSDVTPA
jgi:Zn-dependent protease with chaperone function